MACFTILLMLSQVLQKITYVHVKVSLAGPLTFVESLLMSERKLEGYYLRAILYRQVPKAGKIGNSNVAGKVTVIKKNVLVSLCSSMFCCTLYLKVNHVYKVRMHPTKRMCSKQAFKKMSAISLPHPLDVMFAGSLQMLKFTGWQV